MIFSRQLKLVVLTCLFLGFVVNLTVQRLQQKQLITAKGATFLINEKLGLQTRPKNWKEWHQSKREALGVKTVKLREEAVSCIENLTEHQHIVMNAQRHEERRLHEVPPLVPIRLGDEGFIELQLVRASNASSTERDGASAQPRSATFSVQKAEASKWQIPRVIFQTAKLSAVPDGMYEAISSVRKMNPHFQHLFFSDAAARKYLQRAEKKVSFTVPHNPRGGGGTLSKVYDLILPGAFRADFFRYVYLYMEGGVYVDVDQVALRPLLLFKEDEFVSAADLPKNSIYNAFLAAVPKHPILKATIEHIILRTLNRVSCRGNPLGFTGPVALGVHFRCTLLNAHRAASTKRPHHLLKHPIEGGRYYESVSVEAVDGKQVVVDGVVDKTVRKTIREKAIRLLEYAKHPTCSIGRIVWKGHDAVFQTRYSTYRAEAKWYFEEDGKHGHYADMCHNDAVYAGNGTYLLEVHHEEVTSDCGGMV